MTSLADNPVQREEISSGHPGSINVPVLTNVISKGVDTAEGRSPAGASDDRGQETEACCQRARHLLCNHHTVYFILHSVPCSPLSVHSSELSIICVVVVSLVRHFLCNHHTVYFLVHSSELSINCERDGGGGSSS